MTRSDISDSNKKATSKPTAKAAPPVEPSRPEPPCTELPGPNEPSPVEKQFTRYRIVSGIFIGLLLIVLALAVAIILEQRRVNQQVETQAEAAYGRFMKQEPNVQAGGGPHILMRNVRYCWSRQVCISTNRLTATAQSLQAGSPLIFDDLKSFIVNIHNAKVLISPQTLQGMFNESVFNYPGSNLRNLTVGIRQSGVENRIKLAGSLKYFLWIPFIMDTNLKVDQATNTLLISVYKLRVFGFIPATWLIQLKPFNLEKLIALPPNKYLSVYRNQMRVKPFGLFPPPRINGKMSGITVTPTMIQLGFSGSEPGFAQGGPAHGIMLQGGSARFGRIGMTGVDIVLNDANPGTPFTFSLLNYLAYLPQSQVQLKANGGVILRMPDHRSIPDISRNIEHPANDDRLTHKKGISKDATSKAENEETSGPWQRFKNKMKGWLGLQ